MSHINRPTPILGRWSLGAWKVTISKRARNRWAPWVDFIITRTHKAHRTHCIPRDSNGLTILTHLVVVPFWSPVIGTPVSRGHCSHSMALRPGAPETQMWSVRPVRRNGVRGNGRPPPIAISEHWLVHVHTPRNVVGRIGWETLQAEWPTYCINMDIKHLFILKY